MNVGSLKWEVVDFDSNIQKITRYNILRYREDDIKKLKKKCETKEEFAEELRKQLMWRYWSKAEHELIISRTEDGRILLSPWCGCRDEEKAIIDVTNDESYDWKGFADQHIKEQIFGNRAKIDVYDQIMYADNFTKLVDYLWYTRLKYERDNPKFHKEEN